MDTFTITIIFLLVCTFVGSIIKGRAKDRCYNDFSKSKVIINKKDGTSIKGIFNVTSANLEIHYEHGKHVIEDKYPVINFIIYKKEYGDIMNVLRYVDDLSDKEKKQRIKMLKKLLRPGMFSVLWRKIRSLFSTIRDSVMELVSLFMGKVKTATPVGKVLSGQDKYMNQMQGHLSETINFSYEPILERYIGQKVVFFFNNADKKQVHQGILKDYTSVNIELLDVEYIKDDGTMVIVDIVIPRALAVVRHAAA